LIAVMVSFARAIVIPVLFALLFGVVLRPVEKFFTKRLRIPRVISILLTVIILLLIIGTVLSLAVYEVTRFLDDLPALKKNISLQFENVRLWVMNNLDINYSRQDKYIVSATEQTMNPGKIMERTKETLTGIFTSVIVIPVLMFLVMYYRVLFLDFFMNAFGEKNRNLMTNILMDSKEALQKYVGGLFLEMICVTILQTLTMYFIGVEYPLFIGLITGALNLIPYLGILIASAIAILIGFASGSDLTQIVYMILGFMGVQFIDNNILLPNLVSGRVSINAFFSIVGVISGGIICGIPGMFLSIPLMALIKVILDNIDGLQNWGKLMGDHLPKTVRWRRLRFPKID
ncbi:MAG TPA: AI-2E family transporter, partial [Bacteroidia bacterium]|nr:AI-2E family transporter [Bacteroidia bacterium]